MGKDAKWQLQFSNFRKALLKLSQTIDYLKENFLEKEDSNPILDEIIKDGLIHRFENTMELAWSTMREYAADQGGVLGGGNGYAVREAIQLQLIPEGKVWMDMLIDKIPHAYNEETANEIYTKILNDYYPAFLAFQKTMEEKRNGNRESDYGKWIT